MGELIALGFESDLGPSMGLQLPNGTTILVCASSAIVVAGGAPRENAMEENSEGFEEACEKALKSVGDDALAHSVVVVSVDQQAIRNRLVGTLQLKGEILPV